MNNKDFEKELSRKLGSEDITLPESLSAENIENLINEKGSILSPKRPKEHKGAKVVKIITSAAAAIILLIGLAALADTSIEKFEKSQQDDIIEKNAASSDYGDIESVVLNYYKSIYNSMNYTDDSVWRKIEGFVYNSQNDEVSNGTTASGSLEGVADEDSASSAANQSSDAYSTTNTQVRGVEEADIIKNDGRYIYYLHNNLITIIDGADGKNMKTVSEIKLFDITDYDMSANEIYLYNDYIVVILNKNIPTRKYSIYEEELTGVVGDFITVDSYSRCYAPLYDTVIRIYDISDKTAPELSSYYTVRGDYVSSRLIDGKLLAVVNYEIPYNYIEADNFENSCTVLKDNSIPIYSVNGGALVRIACDRIKLFSEDTPRAYTVTAVMNLNDLKSEPKLNAYLGGGYEVYCTADEMFIAETVCSYWTMGEEYIVKDSNGVKFQTATHIYRFDITDNGVIYADDTVVGGTCINQFSMDKYGDYFRIATNGAKYAKDTATFVYVLDKDFNIVGYLENIAPGEQMKSARFMGDTLYLVTFYQTDPLFIIDLSDPTAPEVNGELKIPGFSSYLHPIGDNFVIGVGEGGTMSGTDGSAKVSLFDVSDPCNPKEIDNYTVAGAYFDTNHKAFMSVDADTFAVCLTGYSYNTGNYNENYKIVMFDLLENGLTVHGEYAGYAWKSGSSYYYSSLRGAFIGDTVFAINGFGIKAYSMTTNELLGEAEF